MLAVVLCYASPYAAKGVIRPERAVVRQKSSPPAATQASEAESQASGRPADIPIIQEKVTPPFDKYPLGPDSQPQPGVPHGKTFSFEWNNSRIFPDTTRTITVYVPAQYRADKPACTFVFLDGIGFNATTVFDNLIAEHAMPVTIAIGIAPGTVASANSPENPRFDRSFEFDNMTDRLARFLLQEVLPAVQQHLTPDGQQIRLSDNPDDRAIAGSSTGGIGSFTVAWQHPEAFHRVFTSIGTFVGMRGGETYYVQVRKSEPRPLRIFVEDGVNDEWEGAEMGDWWMSNLTMSRALEFAGYDVRHVWGAGTHNGNHATSIFPDVVRWLWRDWPEPVRAKPPGNRVLKAVLKDGEGWNLVAEGCPEGLELVSDAGGHILYQSAESDRPTELAANGAKCANSGDRMPIAVGPDGRLYRARSGGGIEILSPGESSGVPYAGARNLRISHLTVRSNGDIYATSESQDDRNDLWLLPAHGQPRKLDSNLKSASGMAFTPDGLWLFVSQRDSRFGLNYRVASDGSLDAREPFYDFYLPPGSDESNAAQIAMDEAGRAYVATGLGVQIFDRNGRVSAILPLPCGDAPTGIAFGGPGFDILFVAAGSNIYTRKLKTKGVPPWASPEKLPTWNPG